MVNVKKDVTWPNVPYRTNHDSLDSSVVYSDYIGHFILKLTELEKRNLSEWHNSSSSVDYSKRETSVAREIGRQYREIDKNLTNYFLENDGTYCNLRIGPGEFAKYAYNICSYF